MYKSLFTASLLALAVAAPIAQAHQAGDIIVRAGAITVDPHEDSSNVKIGGVKAAGTAATLDSDTQLGLNFAYMLTDQLGVELLAATPFSHDIGTKGLGGQALAFIQCGIQRRSSQRAAGQHQGHGQGTEGEAIHAQRILDRQACFKKRNIII